MRYVRKTEESSEAGRNLVSFDAIISIAIANMYGKRMEDMYETSEVFDGAETELNGAIGKKQESNPGEELEGSEKEWKDIVAGRDSGLEPRAEKERRA
jgi:hypothetical protein